MLSVKSKLRRSNKKQCWNGVAQKIWSVAANAVSHMIIFCIHVEGYDIFKTSYQHGDISSIKNVLKVTNTMYLLDYL